MYEEMTVIYADVLFFINFFIDALCLFVAGRVCSRAFKVWRMIAAAVFGGGYSFLPFLIDLPIYFKVPLHICAAFLITLIAFGSGGAKKNILTLGGFIIACTLLGGAVTAAFGTEVGEHARPIVIILICAVAALSLTVYGLIFASGAKAGTARIKVFCGGEIFYFNLLKDSGNLVTEPFSALPVIIVSSSAFPFPFDSPESEAFPYPIRAIPYKTSAGSGCFFGFLPDGIELILKNGKAKKIKAYIGIDTENASYSGYDGLLPASVF